MGRGAHALLRGRGLLHRFPLQRGPLRIAVHVVHGVETVDQLLEPAGHPERAGTDASPGCRCGAGRRRAPISGRLTGRAGR